MRFLSYMKRSGRHLNHTRSAPRIRYGVGILRWFPLVIGLLGGSAWAADDIDQEIRRVESAVAVISQEQQSLYQQFQMVQVLSLGVAWQMQPLPITPLETAPNYEDFKREDNARSTRAKQYQNELDRLYSRYRGLAEQKQQLLETLAALVQQRSSER